ncbi:MAG: sigma-70 family RNA polymerase sigma factor [Verrucomicrobiota bacterium]
MPPAAAPALKRTPVDNRKLSAAWRAYGETISEEENLKNHMPLVRSVVDRMRASLPSHIDVEDLYSVGLLGLIQALRRFDPTLGVTFASYATLRIRGAVLDELRRVDWMSRSLRVKAKKVTDVIASIEQRLGRPATEAEVAAELGISTEEYSALLDELRPLSYVELDSVAGEEDDTSGHELVPDERQPTASDQAMKNELIKLVVERLQKLPEMQRKILAMYYFDNMRLAEIAKVFGVTESRICQIHTQAVLALKTYIRSAAAR